MYAYRSCTHVGGNRVASKTPCHGSAGTGFLKRNPSTGGLANGTPLNTCTSRPSTFAERPRIGPELVCTTNLSIMPYAGGTICAHIVNVIIGTNCDIIIWFLSVRSRLAISYPTTPRTHALCRFARRTHALTPCVSPHVFDSAHLASLSPIT